MSRLVDLRFGLVLVAVVEAAYALIGLLPPSLLGKVTGWDLSPDGQWVARLLAVALASQALVAWVLRHRPHRGVAGCLAFYQLASATVDWLVWLTIPGVFATTQAKVGVLVAIPTHYLIGLLLILGIRVSRGHDTTHQM
ncbi:hypothetical protein [Phytohabitans rumicis]|uniref:Uncharacterized protein n=1 Tax=Phytohabitans rumicis TaxID=1076125 RepID=A0A6V8KVY5_9ACTN|nr:hypothetical protein [Phytohabitans rumicis]GFJ86888.1 hypothetical protein Prum_005300 [Phytohabitans rumicis]